MFRIKNVGQGKDLVCEEEAYFQYTSPYDVEDTHEVYLCAGKYFTNGRMAIEMLDKDTHQALARVTVNLASEQLDFQNGPNVAFIDTNNLPNIAGFLDENGIAELTGNYGVSGFCTYPEMVFNMNKVWSLEEEENDE